MKSLNFLFLAFVSLTILFSSFKKDNDTPTSLQIKVTDQGGNPVSGATVMLFTNIKDWTNLTNQVGTTQTSDANGIVNFTNLTAQTIVYCWFAQKGCMNNHNNSSMLEEPLTANTINSVTTALTWGTGRVQFASKVSDTIRYYKIYINGTEYHYFSGIKFNTRREQPTFESGGHEFLTTGDLPVGSYTFRLLEVKYVKDKIAPIDVSFKDNITCGAVTIVLCP